MRHIEILQHFYCNFFKKTRIWRGFERLQSKCHLILRQGLSSTKWTWKALK